MAKVTIILKKLRVLKFQKNEKNVLKNDRNKSNL